MFRSAANAILGLAFVGGIITPASASTDSETRLLRYRARTVTGQRFQSAAREFLAKGETQRARAVGQWIRVAERTADGTRAALVHPKTLGFLAYAKKVGPALVYRDKLGELQITPDAKNPKKLYLTLYRKDGKRFVITASREVAAGGGGRLIVTRALLPSDLGGKSRKQVIAPILSKYRLANEMTREAAAPDIYR